MYNKGEWKIERLPVTGGLAIYANGELVAGGLIEANARLLAQAPKLYEALKGLLTWAELSYTDDTGEWADKNDPAIIQAKQAIAPVEEK